MAHSSRRNVEGGNRRTAVKEKRTDRTMEMENKKNENMSARGNSGACTNVELLFARPLFSALSVHPSCIPCISSSLRQPPLPRLLFPGSLPSSPLASSERARPALASVLFYFSRFQSTQTGFKIPPAEKSECHLSLFHSYISSFPPPSLPLPLLFLPFLFLLLLPFSSSSIRLPCLLNASSHRPAFRRSPSHLSSLLSRPSLPASVQHCFVRCIKVYE